jgi:diguanylate cyclase (GGDEF)-like protein/PAS domain S-box-containing protein
MFLRDISEQIRQEQELKHLAAIVEGSNDAIFSLSIHGVVKSWNLGAEHIYGYKREEMIGSLITQLKPSGESDELTELIAKLRQGHSSADRYETKHKRKDDQNIFVSLMLSPVKDVDGHIIGASVISRDITKEKLLAEALIKERNGITGANQVLSRQAIRLARQASQMELLAEMSGLLQVCETDDEVYFVISQFSDKFFPDASGALYVPNVNDRSMLDRAINWGDSQPTNDAFLTSNCLASHRAQTHMSCRTKRNEMCEHLSHRDEDHTYLCAPIVLRGELLGVVCLEWQAREVISEDETLTVRVLGDAALALSNLRLRQKLRELSVRDPLTGLFNRRYLEEFFGQELARSRRQSRNLSLLIFDIDHFKKFNDNFGHEAGDAVLHNLGLFLRKNVRASDVICRYGGEEIVVLLPETPLDSAIGRAEFIRKGVRELQIDSAGVTLPPVTLSIGVSSFPTHGDSNEIIFRAADAALYRAKENGRDRVEVAFDSPVAK